MCVESYTTVVVVVVVVDSS